MTHWIPAYIGLGANIGDPVAQIRDAWQRISVLSGCRDAQLSHLYLSEPMGPPGQPDYFNAAGAVLTTMPAVELLEHLLRIESDMGRIRDDMRWGPRIIDLDLLVYAEQTIDRKGLCVPHPGVHERNFVLYPLADIAPDLCIPGKGQVSNLMALTGDRGLERINRS